MEENALKLILNDIIARCMTMTPPGVEQADLIKALDRALQRSGLYVCRQGHKEPHVRADDVCGRVVSVSLTEAGIVAKLEPYGPWGEFLEKLIKEKRLSADSFQIVATCRHVGNRIDIVAPYLTFRPEHVR